MTFKLPTVAEMDATRRGKPLPKPLPRMLAKKAKEKAKVERGRQFRAEVWARDGGKSRATGKPLVKSGTTDWALLGEVDHSIPRSLAPERIYDTSNGILLSKEENRLRKVRCPRAPEFAMFDYSGPDNRALPQDFVWRDADGKVLRRTKG